MCPSGWLGGWAGGQVLGGFACLSLIGVLHRAEHAPPPGPHPARFDAFLKENDGLVQEALRRAEAETKASAWGKGGGEGGGGAVPWAGAILR